MEVGALGAGWWGRDTGVGYQTRAGVPDRKDGFQTWRWGSRHGDGIPVRDGLPDKGWGSRHEMGFQTRDGVPDKGWGSRQGMGFQTRDGVPHMGMGFQTRDGVPDMGWVPDRDVVPVTDMG